MRRCVFFLVVHRTGSADGGGQALAFLKSDALAREVEALIAQARASGIKGSPVVIVDGRFKLDGVQTTDTYVQVRLAYT